MAILYDQEEGKLNEAELALLERAAHEVLASEAALYPAAKGLLNPELEVSLSTVTIEEIHAINRNYRAVDAPTDVLSFPQFEAPEDLPEEGEAALGDVVICLDKVKEQAAEYGHSEDRELCYLFVHSMLHLLGYDHMEDEEKGQMRGREEEVMEALGVTR